MRARCPSRIVLWRKQYSLSLLPLYVGKLEKKFHIWSCRCSEILVWHLHRQSSPWGTGSQYPLHGLLSMIKNRWIHNQPAVIEALWVQNCCDQALFHLQSTLPDSEKLYWLWTWIRNSNALTYLSAELDANHLSVPMFSGFINLHQYVVYYPGLVALVLLVVGVSLAAWQGLDQMGWTLSGCLQSNWMTVTQLFSAEGCLVVL